MPAPFSINRALTGDPVQTVSGKPVRIICFDRKSKVTPIIALIEFDNGREICRGYNVEGRFQNEEAPSEFDLEMVDE